MRMHAAGLYSCGALHGKLGVCNSYIHGCYTVAPVALSESKLFFVEVSARTSFEIVVVFQLAPCVDIRRCVAIGLQVSTRSRTKIRVAYG